MESSIAFIVIRQRGDEEPKVRVWTQEYQKAFSEAIDRKYGDDDSEGDPDVVAPQPIVPQLTSDGWPVFLNIMMRTLRENPSAITYTPNAREWDDVPTRRIILQLQLAIRMQGALWPRES